MRPIGFAAARLLLPGVLLISCAALAGCGGLGRALGVSKASPDEFSIVTKAPLVIPPDYSLKPPAPGGNADQAGAEAEAQKALMGDTSTFSTSMSGGERSLVTAAGAQYADPLIRQVIDQEYAGLVDKSPDLTERLVFWDNPVLPVNAEINPSAESHRLSEEGNSPKTPARVQSETPVRSPNVSPNAAVPDRVEGQPVPTIGKKKSKGLLGGVL